MEWPGESEKQEQTIERTAEDGVMEIMDQELAQDRRYVMLLPKVITNIPEKNS